MVQGARVTLLRDFDALGLAQIQIFEFVDGIGVGAPYLGAQHHGHGIEEDSVAKQRERVARHRSNLARKPAQLPSHNLRVLSKRCLAPFHGVKLRQRCVAVLIKELFALGRNASRVQAGQKLAAHLHCHSVGVGAEQAREHPLFLGLLLSQQLKRLRSPLCTARDQNLVGSDCDVLVEPLARHAALLLPLLRQRTHLIVPLPVMDGVSVTALLGLIGIRRRGICMTNEDDAIDARGL